MTFRRRWHQQPPGLSPWLRGSDRPVTNWPRALFGSGRAHSVISPVLSSFEALPPGKIATTTRAVRLSLNRFRALQPQFTEEVVDHLEIAINLFGFRLNTGCGARRVDRIPDAAVGQVDPLNVEQLDVKLSRASAAL